MHVKFYRGVISYSGVIECLNFNDFFLSSAITR